MSVLAVRDAHASWYSPGPGQENRNIAAEAYQTAVDHLRTELGIDINGSVPPGSTASAKDIFALVEKAKRKYENKSKEHTGARQWLEKLSNRIMYYSKVFDTLAQQHPEYVALAWGSVKLVLTGVINRATLVQKLSQALVAIGHVLPRADLSAELYQTEYMEVALSQLYVYILQFLQLCVRWYNRSPLGRLWSAITTPFELDYQELAAQIRICSTAVEDLANAGARAEIRHIRTVLEFHHSQSIERDIKLLQKQTEFETSIVQLIQDATSIKTITKQISGEVRGMAEGVYRIEFHNVVQFFSPKVLPDTALLKVQSFARRDPTPSMDNPSNLKVQDAVRDWAFGEHSSLLVVRVGLRAQKQAKELATSVVQTLKLSEQCVFWHISPPRVSECAGSIAEILKGIIYQVLQHSGGLFTQLAEQLNLSKIQSSHTEREWVDLIRLLFSKLPKAFVVIETEAIHKSYGHAPAWAERFMELLQSLIDRISTTTTQLKILLVVYGNSSNLILIRQNKRASLSHHCSHRSRLACGISLADLDCTQTCGSSRGRKYKF